MGRLKIPHGYYHNNNNNTTITHDGVVRAYVTSDKIVHETNADDDIPIVTFKSPCGYVRYAYKIYDMTKNPRAVRIK